MTALELVSAVPWATHAATRYTYYSPDHGAYCRVMVSDVEAQYMNAGGAEHFARERAEGHFRRHRRLQSSDGN